MRSVIAGVTILLATFAAQAAILAPQLYFEPDTSIRTSKNWTLRVTQSEAHKTVIVLSVLGTTAGSKRQSVSLVNYCLDKDYLGVSFLMLPDEDRFHLLSDQTAKYKLRDDLEKNVPVVPIDGFAAEYETYLEHLEPSVRTANLFMIKHPADANAILLNSRKGGNLLVSMKDRHDVEFQLQFDVGGLTELHDTVRKKCGW